MTPAEPRLRAEELRRDALALLEKAEFAAALATYDRALEIARETGDADFEDWMFACRAAAASEAGPADAELLELKRILLRTNVAETAFRAAYTAARVYELRRDFKKALFYSRLATQHAESVDDPLLRLGAANQRGMLLTVDSRFPDAVEAFERARSLAGTIPSFSRVFRALLDDNLGYCYLSLDRVPDGLALVHGALDTLEAEGARGHTLYPLVDLCYGYLKIDRFAEARYFGEAALERLPLAPSEDLERPLLYLMGEACHLAGDVEAAQAHFDRLASKYPEFRNLRAYLEVFDFRNVINLRT